MQTKQSGIASAQTASGGSVKLGNIYDEHKLVSVKMILDDNVSNQDFLEQANVDDYKVAFKGKLTELANLINKARLK